MKVLSFKTLGLFGWMCSSAGWAATGSDLRLGMPSYAGTGCPSGSASATLSPDGSALSVLFDQFTAEAGGTTGRSMDRKSCDVAIPVQIPQGLSISLYKVDYRGFTGIPVGGSASFNVEYFFAGTRGPVFQRDFGAGSSDYFIPNQLQGVAVAWSKCGEQVNLRTNISMVARTNGASEQTLATVDSQDIKAGLVYALQWRSCDSSGPFDPGPGPINPGPGPINPSPVPGPSIPYPVGQAAYTEVGSSTVYVGNGSLTGYLGAQRQLLVSDSRTGRVTDLGGGLTSDPIGIRYNNTDVLFFAIGSDRALWYRSLYSNWVSLSGGLSSINRVSRIGNDVTIEITGTDHQPWYRTLSLSWQRGYPSHGGPVGPGPGPRPPGPGPGNPVEEMASSRVYTGNTTLDFYIGPSRQLYMRDLRTGAITDLGGTLTSDPYAVNFNGDVVIVVRGTDEAVYYRSLRQNWVNLGGGISRFNRVYRSRGDVVIEAYGNHDNDLYQRSLYTGWIRR